MKKFIAMLCMITCIFGVTACGSEKADTDAPETDNQVKAEELAEKVLVPYMEDNFMEKGSADAYLAEYNVHEVEALTNRALSEKAGYDVSVVGNSMMAGITSFNDTFGVIGKVTGVENVSSETDGDEISVTVVLNGEKGEKANAEFVFDDDIFLTLTSIALNQEQSMGELMQTAVYDTLMGMGTVFAVLILICFIISGFSLIPRIQATFSKKKKKTEAVDNTIAQIIEKEELSDDTELVAVIAAAIAASEGATGTDGFVVRSIRRVSKKRWQDM